MSMFKMHDSDPINMKETKRVDWPFKNMEVGQTVEIGSEHNEMFQKARIAAHALASTKRWKFSTDLGPNGSLYIKRTAQQVDFMSVDLSFLGGYEHITPQKNGLLEAAKSYAKKGLMVFPCHDASAGVCSCGNLECKSTGKHPRVNGWMEQATNNIEMLETWWKLWPGANIGIATGPQSGVWVLDVDVKGGGLDQLDRILQENGPFGLTPSQKTGSGGLHYFFTYDERVNSGTNKLPGIDTRSAGGLVIVSPSKNSNGSYDWINDFSTPISAAPEWLIEKVCKREEVKAAFYQEPMNINFDGDFDHDCLSFISSFDRDTWLHVGMGLKAHGLDQSLWDNWSKSCPDKYSQKDQDRTWKSFKKSDIKIGTVVDLAKQGGYIPVHKTTEDQYPGVDISALLNKNKKPEIVTQEQTGSVFDRAPGVLGEIARFHEDTAPKSQPELAVASAIALCSTLCARKFATNEGNMASLYVLGVAKSTAGKEHGAKTIEAILDSTDKMKLNGGSWFTSDSACYQALLKQPRQIVVSDELGITVQTVGADKSGMQLKLRSFLMQVITKLDSAVPQLRYSQRGLSDEQKKEGDAVLKCPALSLYGTTTSSTFFESLDMAQVHDGFLGRLLVVESTQPRTKMRRNRKSTKDVPISIKQWISEIEAKGGNLAFVEDGEQRPNATVLDFTKESYELLDSYEDQILALQDELEKERLESLVGRAVEYSMRVALIAQLSINPSSTAIGKEATSWAIDFVDHCYKTTLTRVRHDVKSSKHEKKMNEVLDAIRHLCNESDAVTMTDLSRKTRSYTSSERNQLVQALVDTGELYIETASSEGGRPRQLIRVKK